MKNRGSTQTGEMGSELRVYTALAEDLIPALTSGGPLFPVENSSNVSRLYQNCTHMYITQTHTHNTHTHTHTSFSKQCSSSFLATE